MAKQKKSAPKKSEAKKPALRWSLGLFISAKSGELIATYCRTNGIVSPYYEKLVRGKKALFNAIYKGMTYQQAHERLMKEAKAAGVKQPAIKKEEEKIERPKQKAA